MRSKSFKALVLILTLLGMASLQLKAQVSLVETGAVWKYLDDGSDQGTLWNGTSFNDASWKMGAAELGYGDGDEATIILYGPDPDNANNDDQNKFVTTYFRHTFNIPDASVLTNGLVRLLIDDGGIVYLNETEIFRHNMAPGAVNYTNFANATVDDAQATNFYPNTFPASLFVDGDNVIAVELHQVNLTSSDISMNLALLANVIPEPPTVTIASPTNTQTIAAANIQITAAANDSDGTISLVEFFAGALKLGEDSNGAPFSFVWVGVPEGLHALTAVATDSSGLKATSAVVNVTIVEPPPSLIARGDIWRYNDTGTDLGSAWRAPGFNDSLWSSGPAELGYGDGDEATVISFGPDSNNKYITYYFRKTINIPDPSLYGTLDLTIKADDGYVVYINNIEVARGNMPDGVPAFSTLATGAADYAFVPHSITTAALVPGNNVIAVEVHQGNVTSSDVDFDMDLIGNISPSSIITAPENGANLVGPLDITLNATADDPDGAVLRVEFYSGTQKIGEDLTAPYSFVWMTVPDGLYTLTAVAIDNASGRGTSAPITITVTDPNPPALLSVGGSTNSVTVVFTKRVTQLTAENIDNYSINNGVTILGATLSPTMSSVTLQTTLILADVVHEITVNGIRDANNVQIAADSTALFTVVDFALTDIGNPVVAGSITQAEDGFDISADGTDIGGTTDSFSFTHVQRTGDFDVKVRVASLGNTDAWAKAGLMARDSLAANSALAAAMTTPGAGSFFLRRNGTAATAVREGYFATTIPNGWLRLRRIGNTFTAFAGFDGERWAQMGQASIPMADPVHVGMALTSHNSGTATTAGFRGFMEVENAIVGGIKLPREPLGPSSRRGPLVISEIMYHPTNNLASPINLEFVEIFNSQAWDEDYSGYRLSGEVDFVFPQGTTIKSGGFLVIAGDPSAVEAAYGITGVAGPWQGSLPNSRGLVRLRGAAGEVLQQVEYEDASPWPIAADGTGHSIVLAHASRGEGDPHSWETSDLLGGSPGARDGMGLDPIGAVVINEFLAHTDLPQIDFIELYNHSTTPVDVSGAILTDRADPHSTINRFTIPEDTIIPGRGFATFNETTLGFALNHLGETIFLINAAGTRIIDAVSFNTQANGISTGRYPDGGSQFQELSSTTLNAPNAGMLRRPIVINEIMYNPITGNDDDEFIELFNNSEEEVDVSEWAITEGISFTIPANTVIASNGFLVIAKNMTNLLAKYPQLNAGNTVGNYGGTLANGGERIALGMPDFFTITNGPIIVTNAAYIEVDEVAYDDAGRWGEWSDGGGSSLELLDPDGDNRLSANWTDSDESAKSTWTTVTRTGGMNASFGSAINDDLQIYLLGPGEALIDDVEVRNNGGANIISSNPGFETGPTVGTGSPGLNLTGWLLLGSHDHSTIVNEAFTGDRSLHLRAASRGDQGGNRVLSSNFTTPATGTPTSPLTVACKARWIRGWPEVLLRIDGGGFEVTGQLNIPPNLGSPGLANPSRVNNAGPGVWDVMHASVLPAPDEDVIVTARVNDPDGINSVTLNWHLDGPAAPTAASMNDAGTGADAVAGDGIYSAAIPGQNSGTIVAFHIVAVDSLGANNTFPQNVFPTPPMTRLFPLDAPSRELLVRWGEQYLPGSFGTYRLWVSQDNRARWTNRRPLLNNASLDGTFVYNNYRVIYNMYPQYAGSPWHRGQMTTGPDGGQRVDYDIEFPGDDRFLGVTDAVWNNPGNPGGGDTSDDSAQSEQTTYLVFKGLNVHYNYRRYMHLFVNGSHRSTENGRNPFIFEDSQQPNGDVISEWFPDNDVGDLYKIEDWFWFPEDGDNFSGNDDADLDRREDPDTGEVSPAPYRFKFRKRGVDTGRSASDYRSFQQLVDIVSPASNPTSLTIENLDAFGQIADYEQWMRIFAVQHAVGNWDGYSYDRGKNAYMFKPDNGRFEQLTWDIDFTMGIGGHNPPNLTASNDPRIQAMWRTPAINRAYWRAFQDLLDGVWSNTYFDPILDAKAAALTENRVQYDPNSVNTIKTYIAGRVTQFQSALNPLSPAFAVDGPASFSTSDNLVSFTGTAPVKIRDLYVNGVRHDVQWTSNTGFLLRTIVGAGINNLVIQAYDSEGNLLPQFDTPITVEFTGEDVPPEGNVVINEIMYNPEVPQAGFIELHNRATSYAFDISGWELNGVGFTFPSVTTIGPGEYLVVVANVGAFSGAYGTGINVAGQFDGTLDNGGETITLNRPDGFGGVIQVDQVCYDDDAPWAVAADGAGPSLQLIDSAQDNTRASNWSDGAGWRFFSYTGVIGGNQLFLFLNGPGTLYMDNFSLVAGSVPESGMNLLPEGNFEAPLTSPWVFGGNHAGSTVSTDEAFSGNSSLKIVSTGIGSSSAAVRRPSVPVVTTSVYTMSFWYIPPVAGPTVLTARFGSPFRPEVDITPTVFTPGAINTVAGSLPAYPLVFVNEVQPNNVSGITDGAGDTDPWIELYNPSGSAIDLSDFYLSDDYGNALKWQFPAETMIGPGEFKVIFADNEEGETAGNELHTSFTLNPVGGGVSIARILSGAPQIMDYLTYPAVGDDLAFGDFPDANTCQHLPLSVPTPGAANIAREVTLFINEWIALNSNGAGSPVVGIDPADADFDDWFEIYNPGPDPVNLEGYFLTDNLNDPTKYRVPAGYSVPAGGFLLVWADEETGQNNPNRIDLHADFRLSGDGESLGLYTPELIEVDAVSFGGQTNDVSMGRFPDGSANIVFMEQPTPRTANTSTGNAAPVIDPIAAQNVTLGETLSFTATATDSDDPPQQLTFSLDSPPAGASISASGDFSWTPNAGQAPGIVAITVRVTDDGTPSRSSTLTFNVNIDLGPAVVVVNDAGTISLTFPTEVGKNYQVEFTDSFNPPIIWNNLGAAQPGTGGNVTVMDPIGANPQRFYRIIELD